MNRISLSVLALAAFTFCQAAIAQAGPITSIVNWNSYSQSPFVLDGNLQVGQAEAYGGTLYIGGVYNGQAAVQRVIFGEGGPVVVPVEVLNSLSNQATPGASNTGRVNDIQVVGGQVYYFGNSRSPNSTIGGHEATAWNAVTGTPQALGFGSGSVSSTALRGSEIGIAVGGNGGNVSVFNLNGESTTLGSGGATAITADGTLIIGSIGSTSGQPAVWRANELGSLSYSLAGTGDFFQSPDNLVLNGIGRWAFNDPLLGEIGLFETFDLHTMESGYGAWNLRDGSLIRYFGEGLLADAKIFDGHLVFAMNSSTGAYLSTLSDPTKLYLSDLFGTEMSNLSFANGALYEGSLGFVALGNNGSGESIAFSASYELTAVPEPSSLMLAGMAMLGAAAFRMRRRLGLVLTSSPHLKAGDSRRA